MEIVALGARRDEGLQAIVGQQGTDPVDAGPAVIADGCDEAQADPAAPAVRD
jgi:hypothetical protein